MIHGCASMSSAGMWGLCSICREAGVPMNTQSSPCQRRAGGGDSSWTDNIQIKKPIRSREHDERL